MTPSLLTLLSLTSGCALDAITADPLAQARAEDMARRASLVVRLGAGSGAISSEICSITQDDWMTLETWEPSADIVAQLGLGGETAVVYDAATGATTLEWADAVLDTDLYGTFSISVLRATNTFQFSFTPSDTSRDTAELASFRGGTASVIVSVCDAEAELTLTMNLEDTEAEEDAEEDEEGADDEGLTFEMPVDEDFVIWNPGQFWPKEGSFNWTRGSGVDRERLLSLDAVEIDGTYWPASAESADWQTDVLVPLDRGSYLEAAAP